MTYFSVVIPTHNRISMLQRVLDALEQQRDAPEFETIVINDGSTDDTEKILSQRDGITFLDATQLHVEAIVDNLLA